MFKILYEKCKPEYKKAYAELFASEDVVIGAGETVEVGLGICIDLDDLYFEAKKYNVQVDNKGDFNSFLESHYLQLILNEDLVVKGLIQPTVKIVELDFRDEINIPIHNAVKCKTRYEDLVGGGSRACGLKVYVNTVTINKGDKIAQIALLPHLSYLLRNTILTPNKI